MKRSRGMVDPLSQDPRLGPTPDWLLEIFGIERPTEGASLAVGGREFVARDGLLRARALLSGAQEQTAEVFGFKWQQRETFESEVSRSRMRAWLIERYGDLQSAPWWTEYGEQPLLLDAGCGAGLSSVEMFGPRLEQVRYLGVDVSAAVDVAAARFRELEIPGGFLQADLVDLPLAPESIDVIFSEGVLHHTDSTERALKAMAGLLVPGGRLLLYVYRRKGPIREFTDDYVRARLQEMTPEEAWQAVEPLTRLGRLLGDLDIEIDVPEDIELLEISAGRIDLQRLFYWHVLKAYHHPDLSFEEMNHINYDWYAPRNAHRQTAEELRRWCEEAGLEIEHEDVQQAGITLIARKLGP